MRTAIRSHIGPRQAQRGALALDSAQLSASDLDQLRNLGISLDHAGARGLDAAAQMIEGMRRFGFDFGMDEVIPTGLAVLPGTIPTPIQFLQNWLSGFIRIATQPRTIDNLVGITIGGSWDDEEVIQGVLENVGHAVPYGDYTNIPLASWNPAYIRRTIVRLEQGLRVGRLEEARAARMNINTASEKRISAQVSLDIVRNRIGFYGYNNGAGLTYGFLNDPNLPAYITVAAGTGGTTWASKTFLEITADLRVAISKLRTQSRGLINPETDNLILALPVAAVDFLSVTSDFGNSVAEWLKETYPRINVQVAPELDGANGGSNVFYLYAERVNDDATDGSNVFRQIVPARFQMLGTEQQAKAYVEDYVAATGGVFLARPYAVVRYSGI